MKKMLVRSLVLIGILSLGMMVVGCDESDILSNTNWRSTDGLIILQFYSGGTGERGTGYGSIWTDFTYSVSGNNVTITSKNYGYVMYTGSISGDYMTLSDSTGEKFFTRDTL